jgi:hypothetical protein
LGATGDLGAHFLAPFRRGEPEFDLGLPTTGDFNTNESAEGRIYDSGGELFRCF